MKKNLYDYHYFLDEAGDCTFFGAKKMPMIGQNGVSKNFSLGMVQFTQPLAEIRAQIQVLQKKVENDPYFLRVPSIQKKIKNGGFFFHAKDDPPEVRKLFYDYIRSLDCRFEIVVGRKIPSLFLNKHNGKETEFYADLLSHLIRPRFDNTEKMVLHIASKGVTTRHTTFDNAIKRAINRHHKTTGEVLDLKISFDVQNQTTEPLLNIADYFCWSVQRYFERNEIRYSEFLMDKIEIIDLYDNGNIYNASNPLPDLEA